MEDLFGIPAPLLFGQVLLGLINGAFYAMLSLGLAVIFGLLNIVNMAHGALFMMGAFVAWLLLDKLGLGYWWALLLSPFIVGAFGVLLEKLFISRLYKLDHLYGLLLTFGLALVIEGVFRNEFGSSGLPYRIPPELSGSWDLDFMFLPIYRAWVVIFALVACLATWLVIEKTRLGAYLRAATENAPLVQAFGVNVPRMVMLTYGAGVALAALGGVLAAPRSQIVVPNTTTMTTSAPNCAREKPQMPSSAFGAGSAPAVMAVSDTGQALPNRPAGRASRTMTMMTKITVAEASG